MEHTLNTNAHAVLDVLRASQHHPTALEVYESVRRARPRIGLATVYRALHQLTEQGLIKELEYGSDGSRYDAHIPRHDHAICTRCSGLLDTPPDIHLPGDTLQATSRATGIT